MEAVGVGVLVGVDVSVGGSVSVGGNVSVGDYVELQLDGGDRMIEAIAALEIDGKMCEVAKADQKISVLINNLDSRYEKVSVIAR